MSEGFGWSLTTTFDQPAPLREWLLPLGLRVPSDGVVHRGHLYPRRFRATWRRDDGLEVVLEVEVSEAGGPRATEATIRAPRGIGGREARQPIPAMTRQAAAEIGLRQTGPGTFSPNPEGAAVPMGPRRLPASRRIPNEDRAGLLVSVAELYREAIAAGEPVTQYVGDGLAALGQHRAPSSVSKLIHQARNAGLLPATIPGRKHA